MARDRQPLDASRPTQADGRRTYLAELFAEADRACVDRDPILFAGSLRSAQPYVAAEQVRALQKVADLCTADFDRASAQWGELRQQLRVRREGG